MSQPKPPPPQDGTPVGARRELNVGLLVLGIVIGVIFCWVWVTVVLFISFAVSYGGGNDPVAIVLLPVAALPLVVAIVLLVRERTRQFGAGIIMGLAIGVIAGAGVCASFLGQGLVS